MKRLFLYTVSALLLSAALLALNACGSSTKNGNLDVCESLGSDREKNSCKLYSHDNVCCDETTCTLTHEGQTLTCDHPDPGICADVWLNKLCPNTPAADRAEFVAMLSAKTRVLMSEARRTSLFCH